MTDDLFDAIIEAMQLYALVGLITGAIVVIFASPRQWHSAIRYHGLQNSPPSFLAICAIVCLLIFWPLILREIFRRP
jgi:uncharacterized membrane protein